MTDQELRAFYEKKKSEHSSVLASLNRQIGAVSNARLAVAVVFIALAYCAWKVNRDLVYALPVVVLVFVLLVRSHARLFSRRTDLENLVEVQRCELLSLDGDSSRFSSGSEFIDINHPYAHDLDIFGEGSLFQYVNRSNTREGKRLMAARLGGRPDATEEIIRWQQAAKELSPKTRFRQEIQALGMQINELPDESTQLAQWLAAPPFVYGKNTYRVALNILPAITVSLVVAAFFISGVTTFAILAATLQWVFLGFHMKRVNQFHQYISRKKDTLKKYARLLKCVAQEAQTTPLLQNIARLANEADRKVEELASLVSAFDARLNSMTSLFANSLLLYDLQCVYRLEKWKSENAGNLMGWLDAIGEMEVLCSFGTFAFNHPQFAFPEVVQEHRFSATHLGHPLIHTSQRVVNDVDLGNEGSVMIITGANMAGKSTFLRTLGVNTVLALAGAPVCASKFACPLIDVRSGMRTADSLKENQSYFYAELARLKSIMDELRQGKFLFILLDEILKGTNSTDKQAGSMALVKELAGQPCIAAIATHDIVLGDLEKVCPGKVVNYAFEATIQDDQLSFDYKLRRGIAQNMNATFLMRKMGIINT